jgi:hypothetical protein
MRKELFPLNISGCFPPNNWTLWNRVLLAKLIPRLTKKLPTFYESQKPVFMYTPLHISCQIYPIHMIEPYSSKIQFNIILPSTNRCYLLGLQTEFLPFPHLSSSCYTPVLFSLEFMVIQSLLFSCHFVPLRTKYSNTLSLCFSDNVTDRVLSHIFHWYLKIYNLEK